MTTDGGTRPSPAAGPPAAADAPAATTGGATTGGDGTPAPSGSRLPRAMRVVLACCVAFALFGVAVAGFGLIGGRSAGVAGVAGVRLSDDGPRPVVDPATGDVTFTIPAGTARRQAAGEQVVVLPTRVGIRVNQRLSIRNDDDRAVVIGPFFVAPHEVSTYRFSSPRVIEGACELHPTGRFVVEVRA